MANSYCLDLKHELPCPLPCRACEKECDPNRMCLEPAKIKEKVRREKRKAYIWTSMDDGSPFRLEISRNQLAGIFRVRRKTQAGRNWVRREREERRSNNGATSY